MVLNRDTHLVVGDDDHDDGGVEGNCLEGNTEIRSRMYRDWTDLVENSGVGRNSVVGEWEDLRIAEHHPEARPDLLQAGDKLLGAGFVPKQKSLAAEKRVPMSTSDCG